MRSKFSKIISPAALCAALSFYGIATAADVPGIGQSNGISANQAADMKVDKNGVVVDLNDSSVPQLPTVVYDGATNSGVVYQGAIQTTPADFTGKRDVVLGISDVEMMALNYSWELKKTMTQRLSARAKKFGAWGKGLPSLGFSGSWNATQSSTAGSRYANSETSAYTVGATVSQPLFLGGAVVSSIKEAALYEDFVSEDIQRVRLAIISTIRNQYYLCLKNLKYSEIYKEQMEISKEYWEKTKRRYEADDVAEIDVLRYEVDYKIQKAWYIRYTNDYKVAVTDMLRLIGMPLDTNVTLSDPFAFADYDPGSEQSLMAEALDKRPDLRSAYLQEKIAGEQLWQQKSELFPKVYAQGSWSNNNNYYASLEQRADVWNWSAGVGVQWNALAGAGQTIRASIMTAKAALESQEFTTKDTEDQVRQDVKDALLNLYSSIDWVKSQKESVTQATRVLEQETIRWDEGAGDYLNILDARQKLADSQLLYWDGIYTYKTAIVSLDYAVGRFGRSQDAVVKGYKVSRKAPEFSKKVNTQKALEESFGRLGAASVNLDEVTEAAANQPSPVQSAIIDEGVARPKQAEKTQQLPEGPAPLF